MRKICTEGTFFVKIFQFVLLYNSIGSLKHVALIRVQHKRLFEHFWVSQISINSKRLEYGKGHWLNFVMGPWYFKIFILSHGHQLSDDVTSSSPLKILKRSIDKVTCHCIINSKNSKQKFFIYLGLKKIKNIIRNSEQNSTIYQGP